MICPKCGGALTVVDSISDDNSVYRRRRCVECGNRFYTREVIDNGLTFRDLKLKRIKEIESNKKRGSK